MFITSHLVVNVIVVGLGKLPRVSAHEGPPFPILMDKTTAGYTVSVWADPDIGDAKFFVLVESPAGGPPHKAPTVWMWVQPISGRLERAAYPTEHRLLRNQMQFEANPYFDQRDLWNVGIRLTTSNGLTAELVVQVESTPPGFGPWDVAIYLFPFVFLGGMWLLAMSRRRGMQRTSQPDAAPSLSLESHRHDPDLTENGMGIGG